MREKEGLTKLGNSKTEYKTDYAPEVLEKFSNKHPGNDYFVKLNCPEFTTEERRVGKECRSRWSPYH